MKTLPISGTFSIGAMANLLRCDRLKLERAVEAGTIRTVHHKGERQIDIGSFWSDIIADRKAGAV